MLPITSPPEQHPYSISSSPTPMVCSFNNKFFSTSQLAYRNCYYSRIFFCTVPAIGNIKHLFSCFIRLCLYTSLYYLTNSLNILVFIFFCLLKSVFHFITHKHLKFSCIKIILILPT